MKRQQEEEGGGREGDTCARNAERMYRKRQDFNSTVF